MGDQIWDERRSYVPLIKYASKWYQWLSTSVYYSEIISCVVGATTEVVLLLGETAIHCALKVCTGNPQRLTHRWLNGHLSDTRRLVHM